MSGLPFELPGVGDALGGSIIYDEHRGNFLQARQIAERQLDEARRSGDANRLADALLARAAVHLLQGETPAARICLDELARTGSSSAAHQLRATSYTALAIQMHLNLFPGGVSANGAEYQAATAELLSIMDACERRRDELLATVADPALRLESWLVQDVLAMLPVGRGFLVNLYLHTPETIAAARAAAFQIPNTFRERIAASGPAAGLLAYADLNAADMARRSGQIDLLDSLFARALTEYEQAGDRPGEAAGLMARGDWFAAPNSSPLVLNYTLWESGGDDSAVPNEAAEFDRSAIDGVRARAHYARAARLFEQAGAERGIAAITLREGYLAMCAGDYAGAAERAAVARSLFEKLGDILATWIARVHEDLYQVALGHIPDDGAAAIGMWGRTEGSFSFSLGLGLLYVRAGRWWLISEGDYERAVRCFRLAETLFAHLGAVANQAQSLVDQAITYQLIGEHAMALTAFQSAQDRYAQALDSRPTLAPLAGLRAVLLSSNICRIYEARQDADGMERSSDRQQELFARTLAAHAEAQHNDIFGLRSVLIEPQIAKNRVFAPLYRALRARDRGEEQEMERQFALALAATADPPATERDLLQAIVLGNQRRFPEAVAAYQRHLERGSELSDLRTAIGANHALQASGWAAEMAQRQAENAHELAAIMFTRLKAYDRARTHLDALEHMAGPTWWSRNADPWTSLCDYGEICESQGDLPRALEHYAHAITLLEQRRGVLHQDALKTALSGGRNVQHLYFAAARAALRLHLQCAPAGEAGPTTDYAARAFDFLERGKARGLLDLVASSAMLAGTTSGETQAFYAWRRLTAQLVLRRGLLAHELSQRQLDQGRIDLLNRQIAQDEVALGQAETALFASDMGFAQAVNPQAGIIGLDSLSAALPNDTALLQYAFLDDELLAWAITRGGMVQAHHMQADTAALKRQIHRFYDACVREQSVEDIAAELANILLSPLHDTIQQHSNLIVVPYGDAHALPFHALPWDGQPLVATHALSYVPSASVLRLIGATPGSLNAERILAVGNPARMAFQPPHGGAPIRQRPLPHAATEAALVASMFRQGRALIGEAATKPAVRELLDQYQLLHFATHGYLATQAPLLSSILLADGQALSVYELMGLRLGADLVVLSACDTARGETTGGDDVLGLTRGLLAAGARAAVVSLWAVDDLATSVLMAMFYRELQDGQPPGLALQAAQRGLRSMRVEEIERARQDVLVRTRRVDAPDQPVSAGSYAHPFFWAPFVLIGG